jgi:hypothetical protein
MSESPGRYNHPEQPTIGELKTEIHRLVEQVAKRPGAAKLLIGIRNQTRIFASYKANRNWPNQRPNQRGSSNNPE